MVWDPPKSYLFQGIWWRYIVRLVVSSQYQMFGIYIYIYRYSIDGTRDRFSNKKEKKDSTRDRRSRMEMIKEERGLGYPVGKRRSVSQGLRKKKKTNIAKRNDGRYLYYFLVTELKH
jgi:hypothetical protein